MASSNLVAPNLEQECAQLKKRVEELERAQAQDRETITALTEERDRYLHALYAWSRSQVSEVELARWANDTEPGEAFDEVLADLNVTKAR
jgi:hypothetical protein